MSGTDDRLAKRDVLSHPMLFPGRDMPERFFRYVRPERAEAWQAAGWEVISEPLQWPVTRCDCNFVDAVIVEWPHTRHPKEPCE